MKSAIDLAIARAFEAPQHYRNGNCSLGILAEIPVCTRHKQRRGSCRECQPCPACQRNSDAKGAET